MKCPNDNTNFICSPDIMTGKLSRTCPICNYQDTIDDKRTEQIMIMFKDRRRIQELKLSEIGGNCGNITKILMGKINEVVRRQA